MEKRRKRVPIRERLSERQKNLISGITGLILIFCAVFVLISAFSYLFSWQSDQSLVQNPLSEIGKPGEVSNMAGAVGSKVGRRIVGEWFGLAAFGLVYFLGCSAFLVWGVPLKTRFRRMTLLSLSATLLLSWLFAWVSDFLGLTNALGGGLGGECGAILVRWLSGLVGGVVTPLLLAVLALIWLFTASDRFLAHFSRWMAGTDRRKEKPGKEPGKGPGRGFNWGPKSPDSGKSDGKGGSDGGGSDGGFGKDGSGNDSGGEFGKDFGKGPGNGDSGNDSGGGSGKSSGNDGSVKGSGNDASGNDGSGNDSGGGSGKGSGKGSGNGDSGNGSGGGPGGTGEKDGGPDGDGLEIQDGKDLSTEGKELTHINVREELRDYCFPSLDLLEDYENARTAVSQEELKKNNFRIRAALKTFGIEVENVKAVVGPTVTLYKVYPAPGVRIATIVNLQDDIAMSLNTNGVRVCKLSDSLGIEVANEVASIVPLKAMLNDSAFRESKADLPVAIGYTILEQQVKVFDLADLPHLLVAGATKQGKSVGLNVIITSLLYSKHPAELKFVLIDPKKVEFTAYARLLHHYLAVLPTASGEEEEVKTAIANDPKPAEEVLRSLCIEMDARYDLFRKAMVNNIKSYNEKYKSRRLLPTDGHKYLPYIVTVVDEYADLPMSAGSGNEAKATARSITNSIIRLAQKGRASGIHMIISTQRPSVDVITGVIKANFTARIAYRVLSGIDSKTILGSTGAEKLIGKGDMIYFDGGDNQRIQCAYISMEEVNRITDFIGRQKGYRKSFNVPYYLPAPDENLTEAGVGAIDMNDLDERFEEAATMVVVSQRGSTSDLQRRLGMGYAKAGRVMDQLEAAGIVGPQEGSKPRQVLVADLNELQPILEAYMRH